MAMSLRLGKANRRVRCFLLTFLAGTTLTLLKQSVFRKPSFGPVSSIPNQAVPFQQSESESETDEVERPADFFVDADQAIYEDFTIQRSHREAFLVYPEEAVNPDQWVDVSFVTIQRGGKLLRKFDADVYFGHENTADFGFFSFLGGKSQQLLISQDVPRGGCQWIVSFSPRLKVIFDGQALGVGREAWDLGAVDLDRDGVYEVIAPVTDFYLFQDKMSISDIPFPEIVFRYDYRSEQYLPANATFKSSVFNKLVTVPELSDQLRNQFEHRSAALNNLLIHIYAGEEEVGWDSFNTSYKLDDKGEMARRVKRILRTQPIYKLIYNRGKKK